jgi:hypothetical protein
MDVEDTSVRPKDNDRAVKMVLEIREREGNGHGEVARVAGQLGVFTARLSGRGCSGRKLTADRGLA